LKEIRKTIKQAVRFAKKKNVYPSLKTNRVVEIMEEMYEELEITQKVIKEAAAEMDNLIEEIKHERVLDVHSIVTDAQEFFKDKKIETGVTLLLKAQHELKEKLLSKTRKKVLAGFNSEVRKIKYEIENKEPSLKNEKKFFSMSIPYEDYSSYKLVKNVYSKVSEMMN
jgi:hydroxymethylpyrimidine pyrophosphatase-like HAD family hydrolase